MLAGPTAPSAEPERRPTSSPATAVFCACDGRGNAGGMRPAFAWPAGLVGTGCCIVTIGPAVAAKQDQTRSIGVGGVILLVVGVVLITLGGRCGTDHTAPTDK
jgi:hypothetical protein